MYACESREHVRTLQEWLGIGYTVITDRYVFSNIAYQCAKLSDGAQKTELRDWIVNLEFNVNNLPRPTRVLFLDVPKMYIENSMLNERAGADRNYLCGEKDIHEADGAFQSKVYDEYQKMISYIDNFIAIKCYDDRGLYSIEEIHSLISKEVK